MEIDKEKIKTLLSSNPEVSGAVREGDFNKLFSLVKNTAARRNLAAALLLSGVNIFKNLTEVPEGLLMNVDYPGGITIPGNCKVINENAFLGSTILSVDIEDGVQEIKDNAFARTPNLKEVRIPNSIEQLGRNSLSGKTVYMSKELYDSLSQAGDLSYTRGKIIDINTNEVLKPLG